MITIRSARWPEDLALLAGLDTSFTTDQIYRVVRAELSFTLVVERVDPPLRKEYGSIASGDDRLQELECAIVAEQSGELAGFAAAEVEPWNRRMAIRHLYVATSHRGSGVGRALLNQFETVGQSAGARCLWLDT
jgi:ribosomal protein S18 acetylase RimI-like enzyme